MIQIENKVALITGGSKGIGFGIAGRLVKEGMKVGVSSRSKSSAEEAAAELNNIKPESALGLEIDVRDRSTLDKAVGQLTSAFGGIDALIANAGLGHFASIEEMTAEQWNEVIDTNLTGVFHSIQACIPDLKKTKGSIITISSLAGANFFPNGAAYNASKFGLTGFSQAVMLDLRPHEIRVSTIMPGSVASHFNGNDPSEKDNWKIQPEDIGKIVQDLLQMEARTLPSKIEVRPTLPPSVQKA